MNIIFRPVVMFLDSGVVAFPMVIFQIPPCQRRKRFRWVALSSFHHVNETSFHHVNDQRSVEPEWNLAKSGFSSRSLKRKQLESTTMSGPFDTFTSTKIIAWVATTKSRRQISPPVPVGYTICFGRPCPFERQFCGKGCCGVGEQHAYICIMCSFVENEPGLHRDWDHEVFDL